MRKVIPFLIIIVILLSGCSQSYEYKEADLPVFTPREENRIDVLELKFIGDKYSYKDIGDMVDGVIKLTAKDKLNYVNLVPEYLFDSEYGAYNHTGLYTGSLPDIFKEDFEKAAYKCEGLIICRGTLFSLYYNEEGTPYIGCIYAKSYDKYFREDKSYLEFMNFVVNYIPPAVSSEATSGGRDGC